MRTWKDKLQQYNDSGSPVSMSTAAMIARRIMAGTGLAFNRIVDIERALGIYDDEAQDFDRAITALRGIATLTHGGPHIFGSIDGVKGKYDIKMMEVPNTPAGIDMLVEAVENNTSTSTLVACARLGKSTTIKAAYVTDDVANRIPPLTIYKRVKGDYLIMQDLRLFIASYGPYSFGELTCLNSQH